MLPQKKENQQWPQNWGMYQITITKLKYVPNMAKKKNDIVTDPKTV